jgi:hypothetical protein
LYCRKFHFQLNHRFYTLFSSRRRAEQIQYVSGGRLVLKFYKENSTSPTAVCEYYTQGKINPLLSYRQMDYRA